MLDFAFGLGYRSIYQLHWIECILSTFYSSHYQTLDIPAVTGLVELGLY